MRILVACEFSGTVREAFKAKGHDAWSCDILPTEVPGNHIQDDALKHLDENWDMMIAHPPCTYLSYAGIRWFKDNPERLKQRDEALNFFLALYDAQIERICIENPRGFANQLISKPNQTINPFQFGHPERKRTCLWLKNLPPLMSTGILLPEDPCSIDNTTGKKRYYTDGKNRKQLERSRTFKGIAEAMATQWGGVER